MKSKLVHLFGKLRLGNCYIANLLLGLQGRLCGLVILFERKLWFFPFFAGITHNGRYIRFANQYEICDSPIAPIAFLGKYKIFNYNKFSGYFRYNPYIKFEYNQQFKYFDIEWKLFENKHSLTIEWS